MAIVEMTRVSLLGPIAERDAALRAVADAGVLHVQEREAIEPPSRASAELAERRARVDAVLEGLPESERTEPWEGPEAAHEVLERVEQQRARLEEARACVEQLEQEEARAAPWGGVSPDQRRRLAERGVTVQVFEGRRQLLAEASLDGFDWVRVDERTGGRVRVTVVTRGEVSVPLDALPPPERSDDERREARAQAEEQLDRCRRALVDAGGYRSVLLRYCAWLDDERALRAVSEGLEGAGPLFVLEGSCPTASLDRLRVVRERRSIVLCTRAPRPDEDVPIALRNGPLVRTFEPLVAAFKLPTYGELDPTPLVAPFMGLFFGLCLGDLGYGAVLTAAAGGVLLRGRLSPTTRVLLRWALLLGVCAMGVGALLGNLFGLRIHELLGLSPQTLLFSLVEDPGRLLVVSLGLGVAQLSFGMALRLWADVRRQRLQAAIGSLAWLAVLPTVGLAMGDVWPWWPFGLVCGTLVLFASPRRSLLRRLGAGAWALYDVSGLLGNVASYARIFGLGLSSGIIAMVVNTIAAVLAGSPAGTVAAAVVLVVGHAFNFAMAVIGSVVHPARLQLLEFFNTFFTGGGRAYAPLKVNQGE